jgi:hypothetical protein
MPKKGYRYPAKNVTCEHCSEQVPKLAFERAWALAELLEANESLTMVAIQDAMGLPHQTVVNVLRTFRDHLAYQLKKGIVSVRAEGGSVYVLTDQWDNDDGTDIKTYEQWFTKRVGTELGHAKSLAVIAHDRMDGRKRRLKADLADLVSTLGSVEDRIKFMRERILILEEELEEAS